MSSRPGCPTHPWTGRAAPLCPLLFFCRDPDIQILTGFLRSNVLCDTCVSQHHGFCDIFACTGLHCQGEAKLAVVATDTEDRDHAMAKIYTCFADPQLQKLWLNLSDVFICLVIFIINPTNFAQSPSCWRWKIYVRMS